MKKLYEKSELWFALVWILLYVILSGVADGMSDAAGVPKLLTFLLHLAISAVALVWLRKNGLLGRYGLCRPRGRAAHYLFYLPLVLIVSCNLWFGVQMNMPVGETLLYVGSMICVGFLEELIFRGFLFRAMEKSGVRSAMVVSSVTFGIGHIVNLINGSGADLVQTLCQICYAVAIGFLFVVIFHRGGSLVPCILAHSIMNALSAFSREDAVAEGWHIAVSAVITVVPVLYSLILWRTLPYGDDSDPTTEG